jgi:hypothetical protein
VVTAARITRHLFHGCALAANSDARVGSLRELSKELSLPLEIITERLAFLGQSGSGRPTPRCAWPS